MRCVQYTFFKLGMDGCLHKVSLDFCATLHNYAFLMHVVVSEAA